MSDTIQWTYNKVFAYLALSILLILLLIFLFRTYQLFDPEQITVMRYADFLLAVLIVIILVKYFIPAIKGDIALELNKNCLVDKVRNVTVDWDNVQAVRLVTFSRSFTKGIAVDLIDKRAFMSQKNSWQKLLGQMNTFSFGTPVIIPLQYITGDNSKIVKTVQDYFEKTKKCA
jgi:hypothetical protein